MKWFAPCLAFLFLVGPSLAQPPAKQSPKTGIDATPSRAQPPARPSQRATVDISPGEVTATPEMWFYEQSLRQYNDPKTAVRQKAEFKTAERLRRMAALRWFGFSNSRPMAGVDPIHGDYGPYWTSGNVYQPFRWAGARSATIIVTPSKSSGSTQ